MGKKDPYKIEQKWSRGTKEKTLSCPREGPEFEYLKNPLPINKNAHRPTFNYYH